MHRHGDLPRGPVHGDLFRDNALFEGDRLTGVVDFNYACDEAWLFDLAVTANDWCSDEDGALERTRVEALLTAYHGQRPLAPIERGAWPVLLRQAALRFWLSRLADYHQPRAGAMTFTKDPEPFARILRRRIADHATNQRRWLPPGL